MFELQILRRGGYDTVQKSDNIADLFRAIHTLHAQEDEFHSYDISEVSSSSAFFRDIPLSEFPWRVEDGAAYAKMRKNCRIISVQGPISLQEVQECARGFETLTIRCFG